MTEVVYLQCIKEGSKLRIKIISPGFNHEANCQFPKDIRKDGLKYEVPLSSIKFAEGPNHKFFYRISKTSIKILDQLQDQTQINKIVKIYEDTSSMDCLICMCSEKDVVFAPCGHYCSCAECAKKLSKCPMCREMIKVIVKRCDIQT